MGSHLALLILAVAATVLLLIITLLVLPAGIEFEQESGRKRRRLILGGLRLPVPKLLARRSKERKRRPRKRWSWSEVEPLLHELSEDDLRSAWKSTRGLFSCVRIRIHRLAVNVATPNPALTGFAYGMAWASLGSMGMPRQVTFEPDFTHTRPQTDYRVELSARPALVIVHGVLALWRLILRKPNRSKRLWRMTGRRSDHGRDGGR